MIKTLVFNIEGIKDMQKILLIQSAPKVQVPSQAERKRSLVDDITKKYSNIKVRKISVQSPEKATIKPTEPLLSPKVTKIILAEEVKASNVPKAQVSKLETPKRPDTTQRSFMCISCSEKFQKFSQLEIHLKSCKTSTNQQFKCFCGKVLTSKQELSKHVSVQHKKNKRHICPVCQKVVTSLSNLQNHMMMAHKSPHGNLKGIYMCHVCNSKHSDFEGLKSHRLNCKGKTNES
jgi:Drought induced 19 protein (Di19), zinc-binding